jgi:hypothetical protein
MMPNGGCSKRAGDSPFSTPTIEFGQFGFTLLTPLSAHSSPTKKTACAGQLKEEKGGLTTPTANNLPELDTGECDVLHTLMAPANDFSRVRRYK